MIQGDVLWSSKIINFRINTQDRLMSFGAFKTEYGAFLMV